MMLLTRRNDKRVARDKFAAAALLVVPNKHDGACLHSKRSPNRRFEAVLCQQSARYRSLIVRAETAIAAGAGRQAEVTARIHHMTVARMITTAKPNSARHIGITSTCPNTAFIDIGPV